MTDQTAVPVKRAYTRRAPIRNEDVRPDPIRTEEPKAKRTRVRKNAGSTDRLYIPREMIPEGVDLQWVAVEIKGEPAVQNRMNYEINGWQAVNMQMPPFDRFDGMFMPKGWTGEINVGGLVLFERPIELTMEARGEEHRAANQAVGIQERQIRSGLIDGVNSDLLKPKDTRLTREMLPGQPIPRD